MRTKRCKRLMLSMLSAILIGGGSQRAMAQAVVFPQETQPGVASLTEVSGTYTLKNDLFTVTFVKENGTLTFGGCNAMNLLPNTELFKLKLQTGSEVGSSEMTLGEVTTETLSANAFAVRGVERFNGQQIVAHYTYGNLSIIWRAVLRDGSHYLRTELEITAEGADVAMESITPMLYTVENVDGNTAPTVVGNTRGAVIANNKIFAGLETPMGKQQSGSNNDTDSFTYSSWTSTSFGWAPGEDTPQGILSLSNNYTTSNIVGARGYVWFTQAGETTITFTYSSGTHKLNVVGVDLLDALTGEVLSSDYHYGTTGTSHNNNTYTLNVPAQGGYLVRYFIETYTETITSAGNVTYSQPVSSMVAQRDLAAPESSPSAQRLSPVALTPLKAAAAGVKALTPITSIEDATADATLTAGGDAASFSWATQTAATNWPTYTDVPDAIKALQTSTATNRKLTKTITFETAGKLTTTIIYTGGNHKLNVFGIDYVDANGRVFTADYHHGTMGGSLSNNVYTCLVPAGTYTMRILAADYTGDQVNLNAGTATLALTAINSISSEATHSEAWTNSSWTAATNVPAAITALQGTDSGNTYAITAARTKSLTTPYTITAGILQNEVKYLTGTSRIDAVGVELINGLGEVVAADYHFGFSGNSSSNNVYTLGVPEDGVYYLRYYCSLDRQAGLPDTGQMNHSIIEPDGIVTEGTAPITHSWTNSSWAAATNVPAAITALQGTDSGNTYAITAARTKSFTGLYYINAGGLAVEMKYLTGASRIDAVGMELLDLSGNVVAADYHFGYCGNAKSNNMYHLVVPASGYYRLRYYCSLDKQWGLPDTGQMKLYLSETIGTLDETNKTWNGTWQPSSWWDCNDNEVTTRLTEAGATLSQVHTAIRSLHLNMPEGDVTSSLSVNFTYTEGQKRLNIYGVELVDATGGVVASDYHYGRTGSEHVDNNYSFALNGVTTGDYELRYYVTNQETLNSQGTMSVSLSIQRIIHIYADATTPIKGVWSRNTTLAQGKTWKVSAVVGLIAQSGSSSDPKYTDQSRRSFLAYSERERAVPWRPFPCYISWYELNINRNNSEDYSGNMTVAQCTDVVNQWKTNLFDKYDKRVKSFVWDDGWDSYGTWTFNPNFPNGFTEPDAVAKKMNSSIGAWLGPVGGYGTSGGYRRNYWSSRGGMQLSNPDYYNVFITACSKMINDYSFNFFKFDGISAQFSAVGPDAGTTGEENAEGIINIEREIRALKPDIFLNTTVGTWASPFWFQFTDAVWRQENDYGTIGTAANQGTDRERWITYRDNLVHQNFVTNSPFCPINTLMTHGFILSSFGGASDRNYAGIVRELRCAFACGSGMVELYNDYDLTNTVSDDAHPAGSLWKEIADCIDWQERNADVLPDAHWVGGDPWTGSKSEVYGWASWNGRKATLALRNGQTAEQTFTTTLRQAFEIPAHISGTITLTKAFADQLDLAGLTTDTSIDIDEELTLTFPASTVYVFDGKVDDATETDASAANMSSLLLEAKRTLEKEGIGFPTAGDDCTTGSTSRETLAAAINAASQKAYAPTTADIEALKAAIASYKQNVTEIQQPEDGQAYALTTTIDDTQYYLDFNETNGLVLTQRNEGTAIPASATFVCHNVEGKTLYVNNEGKYIALNAGSLNTSDSYTTENNLLLACKTSEDFGALRLSTNESRSNAKWLKATTLAVDGSAAIEASTAFSFREVEYPNLVTLREPTTADGNSYSSICLPFNYIIPSGVTAYRAVLIDGTNNEVELKAIYKAVPAGQAVVLVSDVAAEQACLVPAADEALETISEGDNLFKGVTESGVARNTTATTYVLNGNRATGNIGFFKYTAPTLPAYKAYLEVGSNPATGYLFRFGTPTAIDSVSDDSLTDDNTPCYDLSGRRTLPTTRGIYIRGGKKVLVK